MTNMENHINPSFFSIEKETLLHDFENYLRSEGQHFNTVRCNSALVSVFFDWLFREDLHYLQVSYNDLLAYINHSKARGNVKSTINGKLQGIKHFYNYLQKEEKVEYNPAEELRIKGVIRRQPHDLIDWEDLEQLYQNYPTNSLSGKRNKSMLGILIYQGVRTGELTAMELKDVQLEQAQIYVPGVARSNSRSLKLESVQILQLQHYITDVRPVLLNISGKKSERLFISMGMGTELHNILSVLMQKLRVTHPQVKTPKQIRASVLTHWLSKYHLREVQYKAGHRYVSSTERYRTDFLETLREQLEALHPLESLR